MKLITFGLSIQIQSLNMSADDVLLYHIISCLDDYLDAQHSITAIEHWSSNNHLQLNALAEVQMYDHLQEEEAYYSPLSSYSKQYYS